MIGSTHARAHHPRSPWLIGFCLFSAIALFFLWNEHQAHFLGVLPYALLLACPVIHLFMHRGHRDHRHDNGGGS